MRKRIIKKLLHCFPTFQMSLNEQATQSFLKVIPQIHHKIPWLARPLTHIVISADPVSFVG